MQKKTQPESGLKKFWKVVVASDEEAPLRGALPLLQVWPSQDSPRGEADGQSFIFPPEETLEHVQEFSFTSVSPRRKRKQSLLHPEHAKIMTRPPTSPTMSLDENPSHQSGGEEAVETALASGSSSVSSINSVTAAPGARRASDYLQERSRRRSSSITARGSIGPYSLSQSLQKLTFTQSLAFPALARGLAHRRRCSTQGKARQPLDPNDTGLNVFAKVVTALLLMLCSVIVFGVVYKYVRT